MEYRVLALGDVASETGLALLEKKLRAFKREQHIDFTVVNGENISGTMEKVEGMMDTIVLAFEKQLDGLFGDQAMDISTDITVLDNMMAREGLTGGDALHKAAQENPVSDPEPELDIRSDSGEADGGITLQL